MPYVHTDDPADSASSAVDISTNCDNGRRVNTRWYRVGELRESEELQPVYRDSLRMSDTGREGSTGDWPSGDQPPPSALYN